MCARISAILSTLNLFLKKDIALRRLIFLTLVCLLQITSFSQYWQQKVDYKIDVRLNEAAKALEGFEKITYYNNSPDTLHYIWFHIWANAYKNDKTAFSEQLLQNGRKDFYFSSEAQKGYINKLNFSVDGSIAEIIQDSTHIDVIKIMLPKPLLPGKSANITTPFYVKLPKYFSRSGYIGQFFMATQWYPKPAVYDAKGWHPMPYLDQGEFYSEFGDFEVNITVPSNYIVAASGNLNNETELNRLKQLGKQSPKQQYNYRYFTDTLKKEALRKKTKYENISRKAANDFKTLTYTLNNAHDFAFFTSKDFIVQYDTIQLASKSIDAFSFYFPWMIKEWETSLSYLKSGTRFYSEQLGEYPYNTVSTVGTNNITSSGGMEYPTICVITSEDAGEELENVIVHEVGHNWFYGILASNERDHVWMDEGMNSFYEKLYKINKYKKDLTKNSSGKIPEDIEAKALEIVISQHADQPIATPSEKFTSFNYGLIAYYKTALWMQALQKQLGNEQFKKSMQQYYNEWKFRHPYPEDFKKSIEQSSGQNIDALYLQLFTTGKLNAVNTKKTIKPTFLFNLKETEKYNYLALAPALGYNKYDGFMIGAAIHNFQLPAQRLSFLLAPMIGTSSNAFNFFGTAEYDIYKPTSTRIEKIVVGINAGKFSKRMGVDSNGTKVFETFSRIVPSVKVYLKKPALSKLERWFDLRSYIISESFFSYNYSTTKDDYFPAKGNNQSRYINELSYNVSNKRILYPYNYSIQLQQGDGFYRAHFTGNFFFDYAKGGGVNVRWFAAKFGYLGAVSQQKKNETYIYQPKLTAVRGNEDYTYSNYFLGRSEFEGFASQQIMMRDGGLKLRTDLFQDLQGRSDDWIASVNLSSSIPKKILPFPIPLKVFFDAGTYADAWKKDAAISRFLYVGGLQLSLFKNVINIYAPLIYSKEFRSSFETVPEEHTFMKRISFSIDLQGMQATDIIKRIIL